MLCSFLRLSCRKMGAHLALDLIQNGLIQRQTGFQVIINDDFLEEGGGVTADYSTIRIAYRFMKKKNEKKNQKKQCNVTSH